MATNAFAMEAMASTQLMFPTTPNHANVTAWAMRVKWFIAEGEKIETKTEDGSIPPKGTPQYAAIAKTLKGKLIYYGGLPCHAVAQLEDNGPVEGVSEGFPTLGCAKMDAADNAGDTTLTHIAMAMAEALV